MSESRAKFDAGNQPWYVGWSNCHPAVLEELRRQYPRSHFLPEDAEMLNTDCVYLGYAQGAIMHLDYIPRLMWQAQPQNRSYREHHSTQVLHETTRRFTGALHRCIEVKPPSLEGFQHDP